MKLLKLVLTSLAFASALAAQTSLLPLRPI